MNNYKYLLLDCDDTILDFKKAELWSVKELFKLYNIPQTDDAIDDYIKCNDKYWKIYERGELPKDVILNKRFEETFNKYGLSADYDKVNIEYLTLLTKKVFLIDGIEEVLNYLKDKYELYVITNGVKWVQEARFEQVPIKKLFKKIFISDAMGVQKPQKDYIDKVMEEIGDLDKSHYLIIGDSITSDIKLGVLNGIDTVWFNRFNKVGDIKPTFTISSVSEYYDLL